MFIIILIIRDIPRICRDKIKEVNYQLFYKGKER